MSIRLNFTALSTIINDSNLNNFTLNETTNSGTAITMGCACSSSFTITISKPPNIQYNGTIVLPEIGNGVSWTSLGKFYITDVEKQDGKFTITAYNGMIKLNETYTTNLSSTTTLQAIYDDIKTAVTNCGCLMETKTVGSYNITNFQLPEGCTVGQAVAYLAGCLGGYAFFDRDGVLKFSWYTNSGYSLLNSNIYQGTKKYLTDGVQTIASIVSGTKDNPIYAGSGIGVAITFENPWITQAIVNDIYNSVNGTTFQPFECTWSANSSVRAGQYLTLDSTPVYIMAQELVYSGGGFKSTIHCYGESAEKAVFNSEYHSISDIAPNFTAMEQAIADLTETMTGSSGGYVKLYDSNNDGEPDKILIMDQPNLADSVKRWEWNSNGLAFTNNNGSTWKTGITSNGLLVADNVVAGISISAPSISGGTITGNTISGGTISGATITAEDGTIGGWSIDEDDIHADTTATVGGNTYNVRTALLDTGKLAYSAWPSGGSVTGNAAIEVGCTASGALGLTLQGDYTYNYGTLITDSQTATGLGIACARNIYAGTNDMTAGTTPLAQGRIYLVYE